MVSTFSHNFPYHDKLLLYFKSILSYHRTSPFIFEGEILLELNSRAFVVLKFHLSDLHPRGHYFVTKGCNCTACD